MKTKFNSIIHYISKRLLWFTTFLIFFIIVVAANKAPKLEYTPYQILVWEIKANEGYASWWYPDGWNRGRRAHSIGFGWNDLGNRRRNEIKKFTSDGFVSFDEAMKITLYELEKYGQLNKDPLRNVALKLYSYNCGLTDDGNRLGRCCGAKWGCGSRNKNVRKMHNRRRKFELSLWKHDYPTIEKYVEEDKQKLQIVLVNLKSRGLYK